MRVAFVFGIAVLKLIVVNAVVELSDVNLDEPDVVVAFKVEVVFDGTDTGVGVVVGLVVVDVEVVDREIEELVDLYVVNEIDVDDK